VLGGSTVFCRTFINVALSVSSANRAFAVRSDQSTAPAAKRSDRASTSPGLLSCSGETSAILPLKVPGRVEVRRASALAIPKSTIRATPSIPTMMFWVEKSRCTRRRGLSSSSVRVCAAWSPSSASMRSGMNLLGSRSFVWRRQSCATEHPSM
jgi:hypothetical protein